MDCSLPDGRNVGSRGARDRGSSYAARLRGHDDRAVLFPALNHDAGSILSHSSYAQNWCVSGLEKRNARTGLIGAPVKDVGTTAPGDLLVALIAHFWHRFSIVDASREHLHALFFDAARRCLASRAIASGSCAVLSMRTRDLFAAAFDCGAEAMVIAHNHPSGDCRPSALDIAATRQLAELGEALDIRLIDHIILAECSAYSMRSGGFF